MEQIRIKEQLKFQRQRKKEERVREKEERVREKEEQARLKRETQKWEREIKQVERRQARVLDDLKWRRSKKFRTIRTRLQNKLIRIQKSYKNIRPRLISKAIKKSTSKWAISGNNFKDPKVFLDITTPTVERLINSTDSVGKKVNTVLVCKMVRTDSTTGKNTITIAHFRSNTHSIISEEDTTTEYATMKEKMLESLAKYQKLGSGWRLHSVEDLEIFITKYKPLKGKSYKPLPKTAKNKKAFINMRNDDNQCFKWAVTRACNKDEKNPGRITKILRIQAEKYNWDGIELPMKIKDIHKFEQNNNINVNVFSYDDETKKVYTLRLSKADNQKCVNLFLYDEHYSVVKDLSKLMSNQLSKRKHLTLICNRCLNYFRSLEKLKTYLESCQNHDHQHHVYPDEENNEMYFKQYQKMHKIPFVVIADFECFTNLVDKRIGKNITQYQEHTPSGFCYTIECMDETIYKGKTVKYTMKENGEDIGKKFVECLENDLKEVYKILCTVKPIRMTDQEEDNFKNFKGMLCL